MKIHIMIAILCGLLIVVSGCGTAQKDTLRFGIIAPSINHLPLSYAQTSGDSLNIARLSSGWEVQEALIAGKIDAAIMPFSYAWNAASKGYPIRIVSFLEHESDGIVAQPEIQKIHDLHNAKIGVLKASTVELLMDDLAQTYGLEYHAVYFRTPNDLVSALHTRDVDAIVAYVPVIQKISENYQVLHWFGESHPEHPCCDLVVNKKNMSPAKISELRKLIARIHGALPYIATREEKLVSATQSMYQLSLEQTEEALANTFYTTGLDPAGKAMERRLIEIAVQKGYQGTMIKDEDIYWELP